jgi:hypothetical protein
MYNYIPAETPLTDVAFQFDIYVPDPWTATGQLEIALINNFNFAGYTSDDNNAKCQTAFFIPWIQDGEIVPYTTEGWQTVTIPFSEFGKYAAEVADDANPTFKEVVEDRNAASYRNFGIGFVNTDFTFGGQEYKSSLAKVRIYTDNWRVVPYSSISISDFDD